MVSSYNCTVIDLHALVHNYRCIKERVGDAVEVMAVVKSDAYGHGMLPVARTLQAEGNSVFGVAEVEEGVALRKGGIEGRIVVLLGVFADCFTEVLQYNLSPVVFDLESLKGLALAAEAANTEIGVHLKVDIGMGRLGILPNDAERFVETVKSLDGVRLEGIIGHLPVADEVDQNITLAQCREFAALVEKIDPQSLSAAVLHVANSAALIRYTQSRFQMVRPGISLYGYQPAEIDGSKPLDLKPVMSFKTKIVQVKEVPKGSGISYGHTYITGRRTKLAVLPVGYADGYLRKLSNKAEVIINGRRVAVRGRICMNACMADITDIEGVQAGDEVVLMGRQGNEEITADEIAAWMETISYEVLCLFGGVNRREYR